jgi:ABC-type phosphate/phosphonate transport system ATPase subunit
MRQKVAIARALVNEPAVILADEPTGELDSVTSDRLMSTLRELNHERGVTTIIVTHDAGVAGATDRVVRLQDGHVLADARRQGGNGHAFDAALTGQPHTNGGGRVWARLGDLLDRARGR